MNEINLKKYIRNIVNETFNRIIAEQRSNHLHAMLTEKITKTVINKLNEDDDKHGKRTAVVKALNNDMYNHAEIAYKLYPNMDKDTARSYFSKKFRQEPDDNGQIRQFNDEEVNTIYNLIRKK